MKSNEEFIAGIYEKAATYTEEKENNIVKINGVAKATRIVAMAAVCIGLAGIGTLVLGNPKTANEDQSSYGIALTSEEGETMAQFRRGDVAETVTHTGVVKQVDEAQRRIWLELVADASLPNQVEGSIVCIKWDLLETITKEVEIGVTVTVTGVLSEYVNETSEYHGCTEVILSDLENLQVK